MENLIKDLIEKLSDRKKNELALVEKYKNEDLRDLLLISSGKIFEINRLIKDLEELIKYNSKMKQ
jgi:hypothetical protein